MTDFWKNLNTNINHEEPPQNHKSDHYHLGSIDVFYFLEHYFPNNNHLRHFLMGNVIKYVARHEFKGQALDDLKKAKSSLEELIALVEKEDLNANSKR